MTSTDLIELSAVVEPWLRAAAAAGLVVVLADRVLTGREAPAKPGLDAPLPMRTERRLVALIVGVATVVRVIGWDSAVTPVFWFAQASTLYVDRILTSGNFWAAWKQLLYSTQAT